MVFPVLVASLDFLCTHKLEAQWAEPVSLTFLSALRKLNTSNLPYRCFPPSFGSFGYAVTEKKIFRNRPTRKKNCLLRPCLFMNRDKMSNLYKGPSKDASYQVSIHLAKWFQRRPFFRNQATRNKNCLWRPCLPTDRN